MNSKGTPSPDEILDNIIFALVEKRIFSNVDKLIDDAKENFQFKIDTDICHSVFNQIITEFIKHLYQKGLRLPKQLSQKEALYEAVFLLERHYPGYDTTGYDCALKDALSDSSFKGIEFVLSSLVDIIKVIERKKYKEWVLISNIDHSDWKATYNILTSCLKKYKKILPTDLLKLDPVQLLPQLPSLIDNVVEMENTLNQICIK